jgi:hypothetical protein
MNLIKMYSTGFYKLGSNSDEEIRQAAELSELIKEISGFSYIDNSAHTCVFGHLIEICSMGDLDALFEWQYLCDQLIILLGNLNPNKIGDSINLPMAQARLSILKNFFSNIQDHQMTIDLLRLQALNLHPDCANIHLIALNYYRDLIDDISYGDRNTPLQEIIGKIKELKKEREDQIS